MNKLLQRLLIFFIGIPLVIGVVCLKAYNHLALHVLILFAALLSSEELYSIFSRSMYVQPKAFVLFSSILPALTGLVCALVSTTYEYINFSLLISFLIILSYEVFTARTFEKSNQRLASSIFTVFYGGYLITYISRMTSHINSIQFIATFLFMVFMCDSFAWFFGVLLGKNNRGVVAASPNKSIAGFIGGYIGAVLAGLIGWAVWPSVFYGTVLKTILLGIVIATSGIIGDLVESVFKRSANCKDSGVIIPGRGGILDSIDSILFSAPIYYILTRFLFGRI
jgi:phosphatidate cytidylyltransferase